MAKQNPMPSIAEIDLPREKLRRLGPEGMKDEDLLAVLIDTGYRDQAAYACASEILSAHKLEILAKMDGETLRAVKGIGRRQADMIASALELGRRAFKEGLGIMPSVTSPKDVMPMVADIKDCKKEHFIALFLNARNQVICREDVSVGSLNANLVHPREVFAPAVGSSAACLVLVHNHPSGDVTPSREDIELTRRMVQAGEIMGIEVIDHLIIGADRFLSLKEANLF
jgi:DNA repair protein RadC